ncbi:formamidopyrimidine-DNA glycosylase [Desulfocucumis palustris]|uniref:Formamidopyrimidine-DNA glycosylase n=1 Tax=Desulfocucumis palustris TaxID=1898651 RepID=A0A2L2XBR7_9FIRM|nr:DNA-formamidopyrimidine glycosylase family protein [Desulfocucumis palustris]GBF33133.1 formamidopyrimidine-DNA glycosylase [Desulfocucumis palustris]
MPELPEIYRLSEQMNNELAGKTIKGVQVLQEKCLNMPAESFIKILSNKRIENATSRGKWIVIKLEPDYRLFLSLGMGGNVILHENGQALPDKYQLRIDFHDGRILTVGFWWFGYAHAVSEKDLGSHKMTAKLGLTPIREAGFSLEHFLGLLKGRKGSVKNFLLNQGYIAGIGNVYVQDILFRARMHPGRKLQTLTDEDKSLLYSSIMETLGEAVKLGGLAYEKDLYDRPGGFKDFLVGYREGQPCPECGATVEKIKTGGTASYICPNCQGTEDPVDY